MAQLALFDSGPRLLVDDATGRIEYAPGFVDSETAARWFAALRDDVPWHGERRRMYDRDVDVPRQHAAYRLGAAELPAALSEAAARVTAALGAPFNGAGLNLYRDGRDSVAPHNDHLYEIVEGFPIALLTLGSARRMTIRSKSRPRRVLDLDLEPGSLLVMSYETQLHYDHGVPKTNDPVGERISIALRVRPPA
ncbi:MAG TPA: alpha-ketoglutarate-dependent dioxygenase AlkB [Candidatus Baltobacteraceae bacterium]|jgi:alkylated DNA repair dioxygenase AlkB|nr:alpha-ketoglutarate-dependent dioxygenase AlkB [Candidatus Baltobacteraceae bacterium]